MRSITWKARRNARWFSSPIPGIITTAKAKRKPAVKEHRNVARSNMISKISMSPLLSQARAHTAGDICQDFSAAAAAAAAFQPGYFMVLLIVRQPPRCEVRIVAQELLSSVILAGSMGLWLRTIYACCSRPFASAWPGSPIRRNKPTSRPGTQLFLEGRWRSISWRTA
jgi:hypothetical protein